MRSSILTSLSNESLFIVWLTEGVTANELSLETKSKGSPCWNGLGKCDDMCAGETSRKIDYSCQELHTCCVPHKITVPIKSIDEKNDDNGGQPCALNNGKCHVKCLKPMTVYRGSYNECPLRYFCCIQNPEPPKQALEEKVITTEESEGGEGTTEGADGTTEGAEGKTEGKGKKTKSPETTTQGSSDKSTKEPKKGSDEEGFDD